MVDAEGCDGFPIFEGKLGNGGGAEEDVGPQRVAVLGDQRVQGGVAQVVDVGDGEEGGRWGGG